MTVAEGRRLLLKGLVGIGAGTLTGATAHGFLYERHDLEVTRAALPVSGLPEALRGLRVGVLTDVHRSQTVSATWGSMDLSFSNAIFTARTDSGLSTLRLAGSSSSGIRSMETFWVESMICIRW